MSDLDEQDLAGERRPIASREAGASKAVAHWLAQQGIRPNAISVAGMICAIVAGVGFAATSRAGSVERVAWIVGAALVQFRLLANMFDGMVAIETRTASPLGEMFNELPDRVSDFAILVGLGYATGSNPALGYIAASLAIFLAYVRVQGKLAGANHEFCGPMAKPQRMFAVTLTALYCGAAPVAWQPSFGGDSALGLPVAALGLIIAGSLVTAWRRLSRISATLKGLK